MKLLLRYLLLPLLLLRFTCAAPVFAIQISKLDSLENELKQQTDKLSAGAAVGIVHEGEVIYQAYFGYADIQNKIKINTTSRFNIASNAKQYTAMAVLKLAEQKKLDLNQDFRQYLPGFYPQIQSPITVKQLLTHTSGVRDFYDLLSLTGKTWWQQVGLDNKDALSLIRRQSTLNFMPGTDYAYSNSNYTLLAELVAKTSGDSFPVYSRKLFNQLEMKDTFFPANYMAIVPDLARPYSRWGKRGWQEYPMVVSLSGDGFLYSTLPDQLLFETYLQTQAPSRTLDNILKDSQSKVTTNTTDSYGFGVEFNHYKGKQLRHHSGSTGAYRAEFLRFPSEKLAIVVLANSGDINAYSLARQIADRLLDLSSVPSFPTRPETLDKKPAFKQITGNYLLDNQTLMRISVSDNQLQREIEGQKPDTLLHLEGNLFQYKNNNNLSIAFYPDRKNGEKIRNEFVLFHPDVAPRTAYSLDSGKPLPPLPAKHWHNQELAVRLMFEAKPDGTFQVTLAERTFTAKRVSRELLMGRGYRFNLEISKNNQVSAILVSRGRNQNIRFVAANNRPDKISASKIDINQ